VLWIHILLFPFHYQKLKLFIADRDSEPGANTFTELCETLENSRKIIILLTNSYLSNPVCMHQAEFLAGLEQILIDSLKHFILKLLFQQCKTKLRI